MRGALLFVSIKKAWSGLCGGSEAATPAVAGGFSIY